MKTRYQCEKCGELFDNEFDCAKHEKECIGDYVDNLNAMSDDDYDQMMKAYKEVGISNLQEGCVNE